MLQSTTAGPSNIVPNTYAIPASEIFLITDSTPVDIIFTPADETEFPTASGPPILHNNNNIPIPQSHSITNTTPASETEFPTASAPSISNSNNNIPIPQSHSITNTTPASETEFPTASGPPILHNNNNIPIPQSHSISNITPASETEFSTASGPPILHSNNDIPIPQSHSVTITTSAGETESPTASAYSISHSNNDISTPAAPNSQISDENKKLEQLLKHLISPEIVESVINGNRKIRKSDLIDQIKNVSDAVPYQIEKFNDVQKYFQRTAFQALLNAIKIKEKNRSWTCHKCFRRIDEDNENSIECDKCWYWYHFKCVKIRRKPSKSREWVCPSCTRTG
ncbi:CRISPR system endoribonuclease Csm6-like [Microplitis demolitor]|uniref:CRISPR system endoribonuclease Csm6-like n=1 Tax=Microplitis demolitor TaxID=69319 RepID=UPI00235B6315|nr:CRISPR system endoribonuclease Csm6-like [Microplitis demolitor]